MKNIALLALLPALVGLSGCGSAPDTVTGNGRVSIGVAASDVASSVTATRTYTPATVEEDGSVTPESISWAVSDAGAVTFSFMTRPGSDAAYIYGYRITRYNYNGREIDGGEDKKLDIYVPSGYTCTERTSLPQYQSCPIYNTDGSLKTDTVPANGLPISGLSLNFAEALVGEVQSTLANAYSEVDLEFFGQSANAQPVTIQITNIRSSGYKAGN
ncbi:hypothetical protein [Deinococcus petrolearius]|uniref:Lipoprotein n=1 Tax=Deinococcus petrolearius TaxID=1751295 RepID=A0ABW1DIV7_9DEIO